MARKTESFKLDEKKKVIILYENVDPSAVEKTLIEYYLKSGYVPMIDEKKQGKTVKEMEKEMEKAPDVLQAFKEAYKAENGFHNACKIYANWVKTEKANAKKAEEATE